jgi:2-oxoglutarate ferredoxin oxidoreductase subunit beta
MEQLVYKKPESVRDDFKVSFCPGCDHGVAMRLVAEVLDELNVREKTIGIASVGCSVFSYDYFNVDVVEAPNGRSLAVATGVKRSKPDKVVFTYQGDGDLASIGIGETVHAMARGEKLTTICINNTTYGMTGGQAGPTTLIGQVTTTTTKGRNPEINGFPLKVSEMLKEIDGTAFVARVTLDSPAAIMNAKRCIKKAFEAQLKGLGTGFVEILSTCPTNWKMTPQEAHARVRGEMSEVFKPGIYKDKVSEAK